MYLATPTKAFFKASKDEEYNIFFFTFASSGHHDIRKSFSFFPYNKITSCGYRIYECEAMIYGAISSYLLGSHTLVGVLEVEETIATLLLSSIDNLQLFQEGSVAGLAIA